MNDNIKDKPITPPEKDVFSEPEVVVSAENASEETSDTPIGQKLPEETEKDDNKEKRKEELIKEGLALKEALAEQAREDERPHSSSFTLGKILGGDILTTRVLRNNIYLIMLIAFFFIWYISIQYSIQKDMIEMDRLNTELKDAKYRALSASSILTEETRESKVLEILKNRNDSSLKIATQPPYIINVPK